jgi:hypothetical protein
VEIMADKESSTHFTFFFPGARGLNEAEIAAIPEEKKKAAETDKREGVWLEIYCPDASCVSDDGRITIPALGAEPAKKEGIWLNLFCPEGSCELKETTDLP